MHGVANRGLNQLILLDTDDVGPSPITALPPALKITPAVSMLAAVMP